jgi:hypothetical protein
VLFLAMSDAILQIREHLDEIERELRKTLRDAKEYDEEELRRLILTVEDISRLPPPPLPVELFPMIPLGGTPPEPPPRPTSLQSRPTRGTGGKTETGALKTQKEQLRKTGMDHDQRRQTAPKGSLLVNEEMINEQIRRREEEERRKEGLVNTLQGAFGKKFASYNGANNDANNDDEWAQTRLLRDVFASAPFHIETITSRNDKILEEIKNIRELLDLVDLELEILKLPPAPLPVPPFDPTILPPPIVPVVTPDVPPVVAWVETPPTFVPRTTRSEERKDTRTYLPYHRENFWKYDHLDVAEFSPQDMERYKEDGRTGNVPPRVKRQSYSFKQ